SCTLAGSRASPDNTSMLAGTSSRGRSLREPLTTTSPNVAPVRAPSGDCDHESGAANKRAHAANTGNGRKACLSKPGDGAGTLKTGRVREGRAVTVMRGR